MGFIKGALFGAAVFAVVQHITKKDFLTGRSILDEVLDKAPEYIEKAKTYAKDVEAKIDSASESPLESNYTTFT